MACPLQTITRCMHFLSLFGWVLIWTERIIRSNFQLFCVFHSNDIASHWIVFFLSTVAQLLIGSTIYVMKICCAWIVQIGPFFLVLQGISYRFDRLWGSSLHVKKAFFVISLLPYNFQNRVIFENVRQNSLSQMILEIWFFSLVYRALSSIREGKDL